VAIVVLAGKFLLSGVVTPSPGDTLVRLAISLTLAVVSLLIPLTFGIAVLRHRLFDIDRLINRALVYGTLTGLLAMVYFGGVLVLQTLLHGLLHDTPSQASGVVVVVSTLATAALVQPLRRRVQQGIDRRFYRRKYDAQKTLAAFSATLRQEVDLEQLREQLLSAVNETMQPAHVSLWLTPSASKLRMDCEAGEQRPPEQQHRS